MLDSELLSAHLRPDWTNIYFLFPCSITLVNNIVNMKASWAALGAFLSLVHQSAANLDVITLPANGNTYIQEAVATLVLGDVPNPITGDIALWSAIMMDQQDFLQGVTQNSPGRYGREMLDEISEWVTDCCSSTWCQNLGKAWCNFAYTLKGSSVTNGTPVKAVPGDRVRTHCMPFQLGQHNHHY